MKDENRASGGTAVREAGAPPTDNGSSPVPLPENAGHGEGLAESCGDSGGGQ
jgi:hypothetical protein